MDILEDTVEVYREFFIQNKNRMCLQPGSLISNASQKTLPSPKGLSSNIECLPHFSDHLIKDKSEAVQKNYFKHKHEKEEFKYLPYEIFKAINPRKVNFDINSLEIQSRVAFRCFLLG